MSNTNTTGPAPLYTRVVEFADVLSDIQAFCCNDRMAVCPDCGTNVCLFCEDACPGCQTSLF